MELIRKVFIPLWLEACMRCGRGEWVDEVLVEALVPIIVGVSSAGTRFAREWRLQNRTPGSKTTTEILRVAQNDGLWDEGELGGR